MVVRPSASVNRLGLSRPPLPSLGGRALAVVLALGSLAHGTLCAAEAEVPSIVMGGGVIEIETEASTGADASGPALRPWIERAAQAVVAFYGRLPVARVRLVVTRGRGFSGETRGARGRASIRLRVPTNVTAAALADDWVLTHEMIHLALPDLGDGHAWLAEGLSTYLEPIARARMGFVSEERLWKDMLEGMPKGMPESGDQGLDRTPTWGRTYWGGAIFCLLADVTIRERTGNRRSLDDALRGIVEAGGNITVDWDIAHAIEVGDRATGVPVLRELYDRFGRKPEVPDLAALWTRLGVSRRGDGVAFDDKAPLAAIRRSITARRGTVGAPAVGQW